VKLNEELGAALRKVMTEQRKEIKVYLEDLVGVLYSATKCTGPTYGVDQGALRRGD
jgi:hypothetical protein